MMPRTFQKLFRTSEGGLKPVLSHVEGFSFSENPLEFFILLARYKFAARLIQKTDRVLDAGCGHGMGTVFLHPFAKHVTGGDFDEELIAKNKKDFAHISNIDFTKLDLLDVSGEKSYDVVVSMDVIEHFTKEDGEKVATNYARLTRAGGFAVIGTPNIASAPYASERRKDSHLHEFASDEFSALLSKHFGRVFLFSMTDEVVSTSFLKMAWYFMALCVK